MREPIVYSWETLPEYIATQQYSRCLGRMLRSLPRRVRRRWKEPLTAAAVMVGGGIVLLNADVPPEERLRAVDREEARRGALLGVRFSRRALRVLRRARRVDRAQILAAAELLERIDGALRATVVEPDWL